MSNIMYTLYLSCLLLLPNELPDSEKWFQSKNDGKYPDVGWTIGSTKNDYIYSKDNWRVLVSANLGQVPEYIKSDLQEARYSYLVISEEKNKSEEAVHFIEKLVTGASRKCNGAVLETPIYRSVIDRKGNLVKQI